MKKIVIASAAILLAACGDEVTEVTNIYHSGFNVVDSVKDLPKCTDDNEGDQAFVKKESSARICVDGDWVSMAPDAGNGDFSCKTEELKDKNGLKIVCNGDSIGVVLNGEKGDAGKDGKDGKDGEDGSGCSIVEKTNSSMTVVCGDSTMVVQLGSGTTENTPMDTSDIDTSVATGNINCIENSKKEIIHLEATDEYVCQDNAWIHAGRIEGCRSGSAAKIDDKYYGCSSNQWVNISERVYSNTADSLCLEDGKMISGIVDTSAYFVCNANLWRVASTFEINEKKVCTSELYSQIYKFDQKFYKCSAKGWNTLNGSILGIMKDEDGLEYSTVVIGSQQWMSENLNYETDRSYCYNDTDCGFGRLYTWEAAMTACPDGWHLPSSDEWNLFFEETEVRGVASLIKSRAYWGSTGVNEYGFNAKPAGYRNYDGKYYGQFPGYNDDVDPVFGYQTFFWGASLSEDSLAYYISLHDATNDIIIGYGNKENAYSVRCVQDD